MEFIKNIIILCNGNSCRSQLAEAYFQLFGKDKFNIVSAGINPQGIHKYTIKVLKEDGIDFSNKESEHISKYTDNNFDYIITVCDKANENCPFFPGKGERIHKSFLDPAAFEGNEEEKVEFFRKIRDEIKIYAKDFIDNIQ